MRTIQGISDFNRIAGKPLEMDTLLSLAFITKRGLRRLRGVRSIGYVFRSNSSDFACSTRLAAKH